MKKIQIAALLMTLALPAAAYAAPAPPGPGQGLSGADAPDDLLQLAIAKGALSDHAKEAIIEYLELSDEQIDAWDALIEDTTAISGPMRDRVQEINDELETLFGSDDPEPDLVGHLVIERHGLLEELLLIHRDYVDSFEHGILTVDQHRKYHLVRAAARVQPLIPAFRLYALIPPRR